MARRQGDSIPSVGVSVSLGYTYCHGYEVGRRPMRIIRLPHLCPVKRVSVEATLDVDPNV